MSDYAARRRMMVETQVRPSEVTKFPIIHAMLNVAREAFVPQGQQEVAYVGEHVPLSEDRVVVDPRLLAKTLDLLAFEGNELVLDIGGAYGYSAAVLSRLAQAVVMVEEDAALVREATGLLSEHGADNVIVHEAPLTEGAAEHGPYDVIIFQGGVESVPEALLAQLKTGGRIAACFMDGALGTVRLGHKSGDQVIWRYAFNGAAPVLPGFRKQPAFSL
ncbi:MAG: protein-L-isoaspartate O-methyltransferase [Rhodobacteraceae bacterium]|nr:protein-L-isoaspartate O-methyltransferase [Paracoccaceae bacterium]